MVCLPACIITHTYGRVVCVAHAPCPDAILPELGHFFYFLLLVPSGRSCCRHLAALCVYAVLVIQWPYGVVDVIAEGTQSRLRWLFFVCGSIDTIVDNSALVLNDLCPKEGDR